MHVQTILSSNVERELSNRLEKGQTFNVTHRSTNFGNDDINIIATHPLDYRLYLVGDVRNDLNCLSQKLPLPLFLNDREVDLTSCIVAVASECARCKSFVVSQIKIRFTPIIQHINLAVLVWTHRAWIDIDVGIQFLHPDAEPTLFQ